MNTLVYIKLYICTVPVFFLVDMLWLGIVARGFYRHQLDDILGDHINWTAAVVFYLIYIVGILLFAVRPAINSNAWTQALILGAMFGFFTYATYDLTNLATIKDWPLTIVFVDIIWGTFLCGFVSLSSYAISRWLNITILSI